MMLTGLNPGEFADFVAVDVNDDLVGAQPCHRVASPATGENSYCDCDTLDDVYRRMTEHLSHAVISFSLCLFIFRNNFQTIGMICEIYIN